MFFEGGKLIPRRNKKKENRNALGCFIGYALLGLTITAGVSLALLISGESNFLNFVVLLGLLNGFSYILLRGEDFQERFHLFTRVAMIIILLEIILVVGLIITKFAGLPTLTRDNILVPLMMISGYEALKMSLRYVRKGASQPREIRN